MDGPVLIVLPKWGKRLGTHRLHTKVKLKMRVGVVVDTTSRLVVTIGLSRLTVLLQSCRRQVRRYPDTARR
jgi:hypothetical protein